MLENIINNSKDDKDSQTKAWKRFDSLCGELRLRISLLDYKPGEKLSEVVLAEEFGISRTPIKRVLAALEFEGLLEIRHGNGSFVVDVDVDKLCEIYEFRMNLVPLIGTLSPKKPTSKLLADMEQTHLDCLKISDSATPSKDFSRINVIFFLQLVEIIGNAPLKETLSRLFFQSARMWSYLASEEEIRLESSIFAAEIFDIIKLLKSGIISSIGHVRHAHIALALQKFKQKISQIKLSRFGKL